jgi:hypothetical protein
MGAQTSPSHTSIKSTPGIGASDEGSLDWLGGVWMGVGFWWGGAGLVGSGHMTVLWTEEVSGGKQVHASISQPLPNVSSNFIVRIFFLPAISIYPVYVIVRLLLHTNSDLVLHVIHVNV